MAPATPPSVLKKRTRLSAPVIIPPRTHAKGGRKGEGSSRWHGSIAGTRNSLLLKRGVKLAALLSPSRLPLRLPIICISISATNVRCTRKDRWRKRSRREKCRHVIKLMIQPRLSRLSTWVAETCVEP